MTLADFVNVICTTVSRTDADSKTACGTFVNARYKMIYDAYPWRDSEIVSDPLLPVTGVGPANPSSPPPPPANTAIAFPSNMDRIVKVGLVTIAGGTQMLTDLRPSDSARLMETRPDVIFAVGTPEFYEELNLLTGRWIRIYPATAANDSTYQFVVVGKQICAGLPTNASTPILRNIDNALIAYGIADMLKRDRHYAKAAQQLQEAKAILDEAIQLEQGQSNAPRAARPLSVTGGTLAELTDAVASRLDLWDVAGTIRIQEAIRRNYQQIYDRALWPESVLILSMQAQKNILVLPPWVDKVISVLSASTKLALDVRELQYIFITDPSLFDAQATPTLFSVLPPVAVAVLPELAEQLSFVSSNSSDAYSIYIYGETANYGPRKETVSLSNGQGTSANLFQTPLVISKPKSLGTLTVSGASSLVKMAEIPPEISSRQYQRLWVQPTNTQTLNDTYTVVGKRKLQQLIDPVDAVAMRGCENALISFACADVAPASDKAAVFKTEAEKYLQILIDTETNQNARRATVIPYTDRYDLGGWDQTAFLRGT